MLTCLTVSVVDIFKRKYTVVPSNTVSEVQISERKVSVMKICIDTEMHLLILISQVEIYSCIG